MQFFLINANSQIYAIVLYATSRVVEILYSYLSKLKIVIMCILQGLRYLYCFYYFVLNPGKLQCKIRNIKCTGPQQKSSATCQCALLNYFKREIHNVRTQLPELPFNSAFISMILFFFNGFDDEEVIHL